MTKHLWVVALSLGISVVLTSCAPQRKQASQSDDIAKLGGEFVELLSKGDAATAVQSLDATMKQAMPAEKLTQAWTGLTGQLGAFRKQAGVRTAAEQGFDVTYVRCEFEKGSVEVKVVFDSARRVSGLWFLPAR
jgi:hypothetical protein